MPWHIIGLQSRAFEMIWNLWKALTRIPNDRRPKFRQIPKPDPEDMSDGDTFVMPPQLRNHLHPREQVLDNVD